MLKVPDGNPERALLHAVARQESNFYARAISRSGALGIMQLMPGTARHVARGLRLPYSRHRLLADPKYNIRLGRTYLAQMMERFDDSYILAIASYNAGPNNVDRWIRLNGDPRDSAVDPVDWIELIPFDETRDYVQRVLGNLQIYRQRLRPDEVAIKLSSDLNR